MQTIPSRLHQNTHDNNKTIDSDATETAGTWLLSRGEDGQEGESHHSIEKHASKQPSSPNSYQAMLMCGAHDYEAAVQEDQLRRTGALRQVLKIKAKAAHDRFISYDMANKTRDATISISWCGTGRTLEPVRMYNDVTHACNHLYVDDESWLALHFVVNAGDGGSRRDCMLVVCSDIRTRVL